jgi:AraC family transcriptional regulator
MIDHNRIFTGAFGRVVLLDMSRPLVEHSHSQYHLLMKISGANGTMEIRGKQFPLSEDTVILVDAWEPHCFVRLQSQSSFVLAFYVEPDWLCKLADAGTGPIPLMFSERCTGRTPEVQRLVNRFVGHILHDHAFDSAALEKLLAETILRTVIRRANRNSADYRIRRAIAQLRTEPGRRFDADNLADLAGLSVPHFFERFRTCTGITPRAYANVVRMEAALSALCVRHTNIRDISDELGFTAQGNFTRFFCQHVGISPTQYRRTIQVVS